MALKLRPLNDAKYEKIMREIQEESIPYLYEKIGNVDWHCGFIYKLWKALGKGSKTKRNFISVVVLSQELKVYGYRHFTFKLQKTVQQWGGDHFKMLEYFIQEGVHVHISSCPGQHHFLMKHFHGTI